MFKINLFSLNKIKLKIYQKIYLIFNKHSIIDKELQDISEYLSIPIEIIKKKAKIKDTDSENELWNIKKRDSIESYREYYSLNDHYLERQDYFNINHIDLLNEFPNLKKNATPLSVVVKVNT